MDNAHQELGICFEPVCNYVSRPVRAVKWLSVYTELITGSDKAEAMTDNEAARQLQRARETLFQTVHERQVEARVGAIKSVHQGAIFQY